ncbi:MAG: hypothetical protein ACYC6B_00880 [Thermoleophilia bacterium]
MAICPVCDNVNTFREQISYLNIISDQFYYDCPRCGAFRMNSRTEAIAINMMPPGCGELLGWIKDRNACGEVPMVAESLVEKISESFLRAIPSNPLSGSQL